MSKKRVFLVRADGPQGALTSPGIPNWGSVYEIEGLEYKPVQITATPKVYESGWWEVCVNYVLTDKEEV